MIQSTHRLRSSWVEYMVLFGEIDMGFEHEKAKGKRPPVKKGGKAK